MTLTHLPRLDPVAPDRPEIAGPDHPMRVVTRQVASDPRAWTPELAGKVRHLFDGLAPEWSGRASVHRNAPLADALARGGPFGPVCVEPGSGTGLATRLLVERFETVVALDISESMLREAPPGLGHRVLADAGDLPVATGAADAVALVNCFLFAAEVDRVLGDGGCVVWVSTMGDATPIWLPVEDVVAALPGTWDAVTSEAGWGSWAVIRRA